MALIICTAFESCLTLRPITITGNRSLQGYRYAYVVPHATKVSTKKNYDSDDKGNSAGIKSVSPSDIITGFLIKQGFVILPEVDSRNAAQTIVVNYGESGRRTALFDSATEITIQLLSASDNKLLCTGTAEGDGSSEADDIRIAINRCLSEIFKDTTIRE